MDSHAPRSLVRRLLYALIVAVTSAFLRSKLRRHIERFRGLANVPTAGPFIIVANHESYFDTFAVVGLLQDIAGRRTYIPTKAKALVGFVRRAWHEALGAISIDPGNPAAAYERIGEYLRAGAAVLVFPEGQRSEGRGLLPFRYGGFNLAIDCDVPVVPVALIGTGEVLPKGRLRFSRGRRAEVVFGEPLRPADYVRSAADAAAAARAMCRDAREWIEQRLKEGAKARADEKAARAEARGVAAIVEGRLERLLDKGLESITAAEARAVRYGCEFSKTLGVWNGALEAQYVRAYGFWVLGLPKVVAVLFLTAYMRLVRAAMRRNPSQPYVQYAMAQYHSRVPRFLGGRRDKAVQAFSRAYRAAGEYGLDRAKFVVSYASALATVNERQTAIALLRQHFTAENRGTTDRHTRRYDRAIALLGSLSPNELHPALANTR